MESPKAHADIQTIKYLVRVEMNISDYSLTQGTKSSAVLSISWNNQNDDPNENHGWKRPPRSCIPNIYLAPIFPC